MIFNRVKNNEDRKYEDFFNELIDMALEQAECDCDLLYPQSKTDGNYIQFVYRFIIYANIMKMSFFKLVESERRQHLFDTFNKKITKIFFGLSDLRWGRETSEQLIEDVEFINDLVYGYELKLNEMTNDEFFERVLLLLLDGESSYERELLSLHDQAMMQLQVDVTARTASMLRGSVKDMLKEM